MNSQIRVQENQTLFDVTMQFYGSIESLFDFLVINPAIEGVNANLFPSQIVNIHEQTDSPIVSFMKNQNIIPASGGEFESTVQYNLDFNCDFNNNVIC